MKKLLSILLVIMMALSIAACSSEPAPPASDSESDSSGEMQPVEIEWDFMNLDSPVYPSLVMLTEWADEIYQKTNGRFKINVRAGGELPFSTSEYLDAVSNGSVQMAGCLATAVSSQLEAGGLPSIPYMINSPESYEAVMGVLNKYLDEEFGQYDVSVAMTIFQPYQEITGTGTAPESYKDLEGMKLRTAGAQQSRFWQAAGLVPTSVDAAEVSSALNTNVIDGVSAANMAVDLNKWYESLDWLYECHSMFIPVYECVNSEALNALPADIREIFDSVTADFIATYPERILEASDESLATMEANGITIVRATDGDMEALSALAIPIWDEYAESTGGNAVEALAEIKAALNITD